MTTITDRFGNVRQYHFDVLDRPYVELEPNPTVTGITQGQIDTDYNSLDQVTNVTDPRNLSTGYRYDGLGNLLTQTSPDTGVTRYNYDAGNLKIRTDARSEIANYSYDKENRISQIVDDDQAVIYNWDNCANGINRLCSLSHKTSSTGYGYDNHGRITNKTQTTGAVALTVSQHL